MLAASVTLLLLAAPEPTGLRWQAPEGCPTRADAAAYLETELQCDPAEASSEVRIEATAAGWKAEVRIDGGDPRTLTAASCEDLMTAAMVVVAVARDAQPAAEPKPPGRATTIPAPPPTEPEPDPDPDPESQPPEPQSTATQTPPPPSSQALPSTAPPPPLLSHWVGVDAGVTTIHVPAIAARVGARYVLRGERWAVRAAAHYESPRRLLYPDTSVGGRFWSVTGDALGCYEPGRTSITGTVCAGPAVGGVFGTGIGVPTPRRPQALWVGAHALAGLRWAWNPRWRLSLDALLAVGLSRPTFHVGARESLFQSPRLGGAGMLGIERRLP